MRQLNDHYLIERPATALRLTAFHLLALAHSQALWLQVSLLLSLKFLLQVLELLRALHIIFPSQKRQGLEVICSLRFDPLFARVVEER